MSKNFEIKKTVVADIKDKMSRAQSIVLVDYRGLILDREAQTAMLAQEGMKVDLGGIAKGYA